MMKPRFIALYLSALGLACAGQAFAGNGSYPINLPQCLPGPVDGACQLPVRDASFDDPDLSSWLRTGLPGQGGESDGSNRYVALHPGASISQPVYAHAGHFPEDVAYVLRFRARSESGTATVRAALSMSDSAQTYTVPLGTTTSEVGTGEWQIIELIVNGKPFAAPAHVLLEISGSGAGVVQVDDVSLVQSTDAEAASF